MTKPNYNAVYKTYMRCPHPLQFKPLFPLSTLTMWLPSSNVEFTVRKLNPVMVTPATPTPSGLKLLSDIDDQPFLRYHSPGINVYRASPVMANIDAAAVIREALSKALVFYYPLAGRLRELPDGKLAVECTGEGALFVEADADVRLDQLGMDIHPPIPCLDQLIHGTVVDYLTAPSLFLQVTRFSCGGFILGLRTAHTLLDGAGVGQFLNAVAELARGASSLSVPPVWARERLMARDPPRVMYDHREYDDLGVEAAPGTVVLKSFFFGARELAVLRQQLPPHIRAKTTRFEMLTACVWPCWVAACDFNDGEEVRAVINFNARHKCSPPLPVGYYGNAYVFAVVQATAGELRLCSLAHVVEMVKAAKEVITEGYLQSVADLVVLRGRPGMSRVRTYKISDLTSLRFDEADFGWGATAYSGAAVGGGTVAPRGGTYYIKYRNSEGEDGVLMPVNLPAPAMERFEAEINQMVSTKEKM